MELSLSAGAYLCNNTMFLTMREAKQRGFSGGFIHIPCHAEWVAKKDKRFPSLPLDAIKSTAEFAIDYYLESVEPSVIGQTASRKR